MLKLIPGSEPYFLPGGRTGALLVHGFTATPKEMCHLAEALNRAGLTVLAVRLPGHGMEPSDMLRVSWRDWFGTVLDGYHLLRAHCDHLFAMGMSTGGALSLHLAAHYPVTGVVAMATPSLPFHEKMNVLGKNAALFGHLIRYVQKSRNRPALPGRISYPVYPVRAVAQFRLTIRAAAEELPLITVPVLVIHSWADTLIPAESSVYIYKHLGSPEKEVYWLNESDHLLTEDKEREKVFERVLTFIRKHALTTPT
jgi:carboxylesterase